MLLKLPLRHQPQTLVDVHLCDSKDPDHGVVLATKRLYWATGPVEFCESCAAWMLRVAEAMGAHVHSEPIPLPMELQTSTRRIDLDD